MATNSLRMLWDHIGRTLALVASGEDLSYPASNLETGNLQRFWKGTGPVEHTLTWLAPSGMTVSLDTVVLSDAWYLVDIAANVALRRTDDGAIWTDVWTKTPLTMPDLVAPILPDLSGRHYYRESTLDSRRGWQIRIYGSLTGLPILSGGIFLGVRVEVPTSPAYGCEVGVSRSNRGLDVVASWPPFARSSARAFARAIAIVTPDQGDGPVETVSGVMYGGVPHWLHDPLGRTLADDPATLTPSLLPVLCLSPEGAATTSLTPALAGMTQVRWRERR